MNLVYISSTAIPNIKAHTYQTLKMCEGFANNRINVELVSPNRATSKKIRERVRNIWEFYGLKKNFSIKKLPTIDLAYFINFKRPISLKIWFYLWNWSFAVVALLYLFLTKKRINIIYSRAEFPIYLLMLFRKLFNAKIYFEAHTFPKRNKKITVFFFKRLDGLIVITQKLKELYVSEGISEELMLVGPDGVDLKRFNNSFSKIEARQKIDLPLENKIICYVGQLFQWKGVYTLADIAKYLPQDYLILFVGGMEADIRLLKDYTKKEGINKTKFASFINPSDIPSYLFSADVLVLPNSANEDISIYYTSPLKMFEYMASKRPIVASDLPSIREILQDEKNAALVEPDNPRALAEGIKRVLMDKELAKRISKQGFKDVQEYSWEKRARRIIDFMGDIK